jgi:DNA repair exonuclease SbcCD ATPase subunit
MNIQKILDGNYNKIYHISDIHIRNTQYHEEEYRYVFNKLYEYIYETKTENSIIVICGDILHNEQLNNISEILCIDFFDNLNKLLPTIIIAGNHDYYVNTESDYDSLQTILYKRQKELKNIYYFRESGIYEVGNIYFGISSLINNKENKLILANDIPNNGNIKIALYHGPIINTKINSGFIIEGTQIKKFKNYDFVLLGDIHKYQYLNETQTIAYSSSLISQNFSEIDNYHGVLVWDLKNKISEYKILENPYRYIEIKIMNEIIYYDNKKVKLENLSLPEKAKLKLKIINSNVNTVNKLKKFVKNKYPNIEIKHEKKELENLLTDNIKHEETQQNKTIYTDDMIDQELNKIEEKYREDVKTVLKNELKKHTNYLNGKKIWKLLKLEFSNLLTYGENNIFDFEKLDTYEITGLCGHNSIGKSSLIDILLIALFNDFSRNETTKRSKHKYGINNNIINHNFKNFCCKVSFQVGQNIYYIIKEGLMKEKTNILHFTKYDLVQIINNTEKVISCGLTHKENTLKHIEELIGSYDDFCVSSLSFQSNVNHNFDFYKMSSYQRKKFLNEQFNLEYFDEIKKKYSKILSDTKLKIANVKGKIENNNFYSDDISKINILKDDLILIQDKFIELKKSNNELKSKKDNLQFIHTERIFLDEDIINFNSEKDNNIQMLEKITFEINNLNLLKKKEKIINKNKKFENNKKNTVEKLLFQIKKSNSILNFDKFTKEELEDFIDKFNKIILENENIIKSYNYNKDQLINQNNQLQLSLTKINYNLIECDDEFILSEELTNYYYSNTFTYAKYNKYKKLYDYYLNNQHIFDLLSNININCNLECLHCIKNKNIISQFINNNYSLSHINIENIINKYNKYRKLFKIHNAIKYSELKQTEIFIKNILLKNINEIKHIENKINYYSDEISIFENNIVSIQNIFIKNEINNINNTYYSKYLLLQEQVQTYDKLKNELSFYKNKLTIIEKDIEQYYIFKNISKNNEENKLLNKNLTTQIQNNDQILFDYQNQITTLQIHHDKLVSVRTIYENLITEFDVLEKDINIFTHINKLVDSNGLPLKIIQNKLKYIEEGVSNMLYKIIKKKILISEDTTNIYIDIISDDGHTASYFGGMEFFICTLCFKIFLCSTLNIPFSGILFIDEGVSALDKEHINNFNFVIDFLKEHYSKVLLITHIKDFKNFTSTNINIKSNMLPNKAHVSQINFF